MKRFRKKYEGIVYLGLALCVGALLIYFATAKTAVAPSQSQSTTELGRENEEENAPGTSSTNKAQELLKGEEQLFQYEELGIYQAYSPEKLKLAKDHKVILFFKADWCPSCQVADQVLNTEFASIPKNLAILKVSYDTELELRKKYGVTVQHTFVQVDEEGNLITKWLGSVTIKDILSHSK